MRVREKEDRRCLDRERIVYFDVYMFGGKVSAGQRFAYKQRRTIDNCCINEEINKYV
jgi:hypothetical protein